MGTNLRNAKPDTVPGVLVYSLVTCDGFMDPFEDCRQVLHRMTHSEEHAR